MKNTVITTVLALGIGFGVAWLVKPDASEEAAEAEEKQITKTTDRTTSRPDRPEKEEGKKPKTVVRTMRVNGEEVEMDENAENQVNEWQERMKKRTMDRQKKQFDLRLAKLVKELNLTPAQEAALRKKFEEALKKMGDGWQGMDGLDGKEGLARMKEYARLKNGGAEKDALASLLNDEQKEAYEKMTQREHHNKVEARAMKDLAKLSFLDMAQEQKDAVYEILYKQADERVSNPSDGSIMMSMTSEATGFDLDIDEGMATGMITMMTDLEGAVGEGGEGGEGAGEVNQADIMTRIREQQQRAVDEKVELLAPVLDDEQEAAYREHLQSRGGFLNQIIEAVPGGGDAPEVEIEIPNP